MIVVVKIPVNFRQVLTSTALKDGGVSLAVVGAEYTYKNSLIHVIVDTESQVSLVGTKFGFAEVLRGWHLRWIFVS